MTCWKPFTRAVASIITATLMAVAKMAMLMMNREKEEDLLKAILLATKNDKRIGQKYQIPVYER